MQVDSRQQLARMRGQPRHMPHHRRAVRRRNDDSAAHRLPPEGFAGENGFSTIPSFGPGLLGCFADLTAGTLPFAAAFFAAGAFFGAAPALPLPVLSAGASTSSGSGL